MKHKCIPVHHYLQPNIKQIPKSTSFASPLAIPILMKHFKLSKTQQAVMSSQPASAPGTGQNEAAFMPSPEEVARRAYFTYENEGSLPGHDLQHWLAAETQLIAERNSTRVHGFHNQT